MTRGTGNQIVNARTSGLENAIECLDQKDARVILCHDTHQRTADHLGGLVDALLNRGFGFSTLEATRQDADSKLL